jgi:hypothetical protein
LAFQFGRGKRWKAARAAGTRVRGWTAVDGRLSGDDGREPRKRVEIRALGRTEQYAVRQKSLP